jgi:hypothetical protein
MFTKCYCVLFSQGFCTGERADTCDSLPIWQNLMKILQRMRSLYLIQDTRGEKKTVWK